MRGWLTIKDSFVWAKWPPFPSLSVFVQLDFQTASWSEGSATCSRKMQPKTCTIAFEYENHASAFKIQVSMKRTGGSNFFFLSVISHCNVGLGTYQLSPSLCVESLWHFSAFISQSLGRWDKTMLSTKFIQCVLVLKAIAWHLLCFSCGREVVISYNSDFFSKEFNWVFLMGQILTHCFYVHLPEKQWKDTKL